MTGVLSLVLCLACYKGLLVSAAASVLQLGAWAKLLQENTPQLFFPAFLRFYFQDAVITLCLALVSLQLYLGVTSLDKY